jgi:hypothetical protein
VDWCQKWQNTHLTILSAIVLIWLEKQYSCRPSLVAVMDTVPVEYLMFFRIAPPSGSAICDQDERGNAKEKGALYYPEINVQVAASANLIGDCHLEELLSNLE